MESFTEQPDMAEILMMLSITVCNSYISPSGTVFTSSDIYLDTLLSHIGCHSIIAINLTINTADASLTLFPNSIYANEIGATYQWIDCDDNASISGATAQSFTPGSSGSYAVEVSKNGCSTLSECVFFELASGITTAFEDQIKLYPNPTSSNVILEFGSIQNTGVTVRTIEGKEVYGLQSASETSIEIPSATWPAGVYLLYLEDEVSRAPIKLIKE
ncbi:MAG: hypothetical protein ACI959_000562 [Limisphaerales bacterium]|jgi:hypothetical protein